MRRLLSRADLSSAAIVVIGVVAVVLTAIGLRRTGGPADQPPFDADRPRPPDPVPARVSPAAPTGGTEPPTGSSPGSEEAATATASGRLPADPHPAGHNGIFAAMGRFAYRWRRVLPILGIALVIALNAWAAVAGGTLSQGGWQIEGSESARGEELLADRFGEQASTVIVIFTDPDGDAASPEFQATVADTMAPIEDDPLVDDILTYEDLGDPSFLSTDGTKTIAVVQLSESMEEAVDDVEALVEQIEAPEGVEMIVTGVPVVQHEFNEAVEEDLVRAELISFPVALLILLAVFGTLVGAALPLLIAGMALPTALAVITLLASVTEMSIFVTNVTTMIGLALSIDYSLFTVSRFREELRHRPVPDAIEHTMATVGKAVAVSGIAVAIGLASLTVFESPALRSMGIGGVVTVLSTLIFGLTVLPALLALLGPRVNRLRVPLPSSLRLIEDDPAAADARQGHGIWSRVARRVMRRPLLIATPVLLLLLLAGTPFFGIQLSTGGNLDDLPPSEGVTGFRILSDEFPGGDTDPVEVAVVADEPLLSDGALDPAVVEELDAYVAEIAALDGVSEVESVLDPPPGVDSAAYLQLITVPESQRPAEAAGIATWIEQYVADDVTRVSAFSEYLPDSDDGRALVEDIRAVPDPDFAEETLTAGLSARSADFMASFTASVPWAVAIVVLVTGGVLFLTFGSVFLPLKAILMSLLSITASFGALVWIFQEGNLADQLAFEPSGTLIASTPILMFAILFGLSMDYEVLLLSRIRERYLVHGDNARAVEEGIGITGGIITGAALIMVAVFGAFALSSVVLIKALGFSMALAVLIDATIVRGILVPAFMRVMGDLNWWAPRWMQRVVQRIGLYEGPPPTVAAPPPAPEPATA